jgi:hypothetical protein
MSGWVEKDAQPKSSRKCLGIEFAKDGKSLVGPTMGGSLQPGEPTNMQTTAFHGCLWL